jgi:hypothetical protein
MDLQDLYNFVDFWSKRGDQPGTAPQVTGLRDAMKDTGKVVDDYVLGGTYQANMRGQDALLRQLALNAVAGGVGAGLGYGASKVGTKVATKLTPKVSALMEWIRPRDVGIHLSPYNDLPQILPNVNVNTGAGAIPDFPLVQNSTYKFSGVDLKGNRISPDALIDSAERYIQNIPIKDFDEALRSMYVTKSKLGQLDPETQVLGNMIEQGYSKAPSWYVPKNGRITPSQEVLKSIKFAPEDWAGAVRSIPSDTPVLNQMNRLPETTKQQLVDFIKKQQSLEKVKSLGRGAAVGGSTVGTALTPLAVARPALGFNNKK